MLKDDHAKADEIAADLVNVKKYLSHAAVIDSERARSLGLNVRFLPHDDILWQALLAAIHRHAPGLGRAGPSVV
jgi:hypothetical protein